MARRALPFVLLVATAAAAAALVVVPATAATAEALVAHWGMRAAPCLEGTVEECLDDGAVGVVGLRRWRRRRRLFQLMDDEGGGDYGGGGGGAAAAQYISYAALMRNSVPCSIPGASYYNCRPGADANPYTRGCSAITQCRD
uniref:Rapid alkalinization factor 1 n=1 Tax=Oryza meridionalis TaxID=40149 RepID=A0A0E0D0C9_9ORYZ